MAPRFVVSEINRDLDLESMSVDQLWSLYEMIAAELARKITAGKERLEQRLRQGPDGWASDQHQAGGFSQNRRKSVFGLVRGARLTALRND
jgi:hypothetical protein